jgi:cytochrome c2
MRRPSLTNDEAIALDIKDHEANRVLYSQCRRRHQADTPCLQSLGPLLPILVDRPSMNHHLGFGHNRR